MAAIGVATEDVCSFPGERSGRVLRAGIEADDLVAEEDAIPIVGRLLDCFRENAPPGERVGEMMEPGSEQKTAHCGAVVPCTPYDSSPSPPQSPHPAITLHAFRIPSSSRRIRAVAPRLSSTSKNSRAFCSLNGP